jgi:hypothetical protein
VREGFRKRSAHSRFFASLRGSGFLTGARGLRLLKFGDQLFDPDDLLIRTESKKKRFGTLQMLKGQRIWSLTSV